MDALPVELVGPIVELVNPKSLENLQEILPADSPWTLWVDHARASRFNLTVIVKYVRGSDQMQLQLKRKYLGVALWADWIPEDDDRSKIETLFFSVRRTEPGMEHLQMPRAVCYSWVREALRLTNSSRTLDITVEQLEDYPGDLLDLLHRKRDSLQVSVNTAKCPILPPFDIPIRLHLPPFVGRYRTEHLKGLRGRDCLRWLVDYWKTNNPEHWDWDILIPMAINDIWHGELKDFAYESHRRCYYDTKRWKGRDWYLDVWFLQRKNAIKVQTRNKVYEQRVDRRRRSQYISGVSFSMNSVVQQVTYHDDRSISTCCCCCCCCKRSRH
uniref:F-box domain-containing protein n=1 Tax=Steinernema glaseri TaxID=37863 RepID=A0A1I7ZL57_9BILA